MSKSRRNRRPSGHPAKVAKRRERDAPRRSWTPISTDELARRLARHALKLSYSLQAEVWGSSVLGAIWLRRNEVLLDQASRDPHLAVGAPLIEAIARIGGAGARIA